MMMEKVQVQQTVKRNWLIEAKNIEIYPAYTNVEGKESSVQENAFHGAN